ncbi:MAG: hypothetical protein GX022_05360 [Clostridiaceae bacterium]|nr:hypothetical protein [Clostridiaceae bacterium]
MGILFALYVVVYLFFGIVIKEIDVSLNFFTAVQMLFTCLIIGIMQQIFIPLDKISPLRCAVWIASGAVITVLSELVFRWFRLFPAWCFPVFTVFMILGMLFMVLAIYLELHRETKNLNHNLEKFQKKRKPEII